ncbi:DNA-directed RNA polymerase III subunit RPC3 [Chrysoperla carnea]|uniref:DNA-directed RNA polymerase III subunit RPC3 n=1 Tax=Chrysoperla carnea TaxID=189513 RepID=UPI001D096F93|nr:DNA-directed RNA polymerase III subunit RPC3 [Chrysoperla carnea]
MSTQLGTLISCILAEYFGETIEKIGSFLYTWGPNPLALISKNTSVPIEKTKISLCFLIKYGLVNFEPGRTPSTANYYLIHEKLLHLLRYSRYIAIIKKKYGNIAEVTLENILCHGIVRASDTILAIAKRLQQQNDEEETVDLSRLRDMFFTFIANQYIMRVPSPISDNEKIPTLKISERDLYLAPEIDIKLLSEIFNETNAENKKEHTNDKDVYWRINFDRFHQDFRDATLISAVKRRTDENGGELMAILLKLMYIRTEPWADISNPIPVSEIKDVLRNQNTNPNLLLYLDQYLTIIENDPCKFLMKIGETGGGQYVINLKETFIQLAWATVENIIAEKYGSHAARIFRLVRSKKFIEADHIPQLSMMQIKDAKRLTYLLLEENLLQMRELRKVQTNNSGPIKTFILFHINFDQVARMILDISYKCMYNLKVRRKHFVTINKPIIDKKHRADAIELDLKSKVPEDELEEILSELITPAERDILGKIGTTIKKLNASALNLDDTIFLLQLYMLYTAKE